MLLLGAGWTVGLLVGVTAFPAPAAGFAGEPIHVLEVCFGKEEDPSAPAATVALDGEVIDVRCCWLSGVPNAPPAPLAPPELETEFRCCWDREIPMLDIGLPVEEAVVVEVCLDGVVSGVWLVEAADDG